MREAVEQIMRDENSQTLTQQEIRQQIARLERRGAEDWHIDLYRRLLREASTPCSD